MAALKLGSLARVKLRLRHGRRTKFFVSFVSFVSRLHVHPLYPKADQLSQLAIGSAIDVHRLKGPGLTESSYERCLMRELELRHVAAVHQRVVKIEYKGLLFDVPLRFDVLIEACLLLEFKCVQEILPIHKAQLLSRNNAVAKGATDWEPLMGNVKPIDSHTRLVYLSVFVR